MRKSNPAANKLIQIRSLDLIITKRTNRFKALIVGKYKKYIRLALILATNNTRQRRTTATSKKRRLSTDNPHKISPLHNFLLNVILIISTAYHKHILHE